MNYKVGTRGSKLAVSQTNDVIENLKRAYPEDNFEVVIIKTTGDLEQLKALDQIGSKGVFVDEVERAILCGKVDMAVHSMKDMPDRPAEGLVLADAWKREDPRDVLIFREASSLAELPSGSRVGTGSRRRAFQMKAMRPDLEIVPIRGNVDTRIRKLYGENGVSDYDAVVLAAAGLRRIGREAEISEYLSEQDMIPAPAQGTLALECRADDEDMLGKLNALSDAHNKALTFLERGFLRAIGGDCHMPVAAYAEYVEAQQTYHLSVLFGTEDGSKVARAEVYGDADDELVGHAVRLIKEQLGE